MLDVCDLDFDLMTLILKLDLDIIVNEVNSQMALELDPDIVVTYWYTITEVNRFKGFLYGNTDT